MKIHKETKQEVKFGSVIPFDNKQVTVVYCPPTHKPSSSGKMQARLPNGKMTQIYFCSVFGCEWIEREDRE